MPHSLPKPKLELAFSVQVDLDKPIEMGRGRGGGRRIIAIRGGIVSGPRLQGKILDIGADWQTVFDSGLAELDTRYAIQTHDGAVIEVINYGFRHGPPEVMQAVARGEEVDPASYYMRSAARLETGDPRYDWVNSMLFVGVGARLAASVQLDFYAIG